MDDLGFEDDGYVELTSFSGQQQGVEGAPAFQNYRSDVNPTRQRSPSAASQNLQRQRSCLHLDEDSKIKQSRSINNGYELSQELQDKQTEMLERKYGGRLRAKHAAVVIQQAFRKYNLNRNFQKLRSAKAEKRSSKRLSEYGRSNSLWIDFESEDPNSPKEMGKLERMYTYDSSFPSDYFDEQQKTLTRSIGINLTEDEEFNSHDANNSRNREYTELNDNSESDNSQPGGANVDLHSVNFENVLECPGMDILNDSFQSDGEGGESRTLKRSDVNKLPFHSPDEGGDYDNLPNSGFTNVEIHVDYASPVKTCPKADDGAIENGESHVSQSKKSQRRRSPQESPIWKRKSTTMESTTSSNSICDEKRMSNISETSEADSNDSRRMSNSHSSHSDTASLGSSSLGSDGGSYHHNYPPPSQYNGPFVHIQYNGPQYNGPNVQYNGPNVQYNGPICNIQYNGPGMQYNGPNDHYSGSNRSSTASMPPNQSHIPQRSTVNDRRRRTEYRVGLHLFNKKPDKGIRYLIQRHFIADNPSEVARFLLSKKGLSKQMIGEYLGNLMNPFNMEVLDYFTHQIDLTNLPIDVALRKFQTLFRMPGEAQKIERLMEAFAHRYCVCNQNVIRIFRSTDTIFLVAFAIIMLNTDLHNPNVKNERKMKLEDFIKNLRGIDDGEDIDRDFLAGIYERVKQSEFRPGADHVTQVMKVERSICGKKPPIGLPHRRLICFCRLNEVHDPNKKDKGGAHKREVFLFNDMLLVTKIFSKKKGTITYSYKNSFNLCGVQVYFFETHHYLHGIQLKSGLDGRVLCCFNAHNDHDRRKFVEDLRDCVFEMTELDALRIEEELQKQKHTQKQLELNRISSDSGVVDVDVLKPPDLACNRLSAPECPPNGVKKSALSNSLLDLNDSRQCRRGSGGSLDSGMFLLQASSSSMNTMDHESEVPPPIPPKSKKLSSASSLLYTAAGRNNLPPPSPNRQGHRNSKSSPNPKTICMNSPNDGTDV